jgi:hypothetical protein
MAQPKSKHRPKKTTTHHNSHATTMHAAHQKSQSVQHTSEPADANSATTTQCPPHIMLNKTPFLLAPITANT